jgi:hypothetical protein
VPLEHRDKVRISNQRLHPRLGSSQLAVVLDLLVGEAAADLVVVLVRGRRRDPLQRKPNPPLLESLFQESTLEMSEPLVPQIQT